MDTRRWFLDTEFNEDGRTIDLISIALVAENGEAYYAVSEEFDAEKCNDFVKSNVLPKLPVRGGDPWKSRDRIAKDVRTLLLSSGNAPEVWSYFGEYDWVAVCQLYGPMVQLPRGFPMQCHDLKQLMEDWGAEETDLPPKDPAGERNALAGALWIRSACLYLWDDQRKHEDLYVKWP